MQREQAIPCPPLQLLVAEDEAPTLLIGIEKIPIRGESADLFRKLGSKRQEISKPGDSRQWDLRRQGHEARTGEVGQLVGTVPEA